MSDVLVWAGIAALVVVAGTTVVEVDVETDVVEVVEGSTRTDSVVVDDAEIASVVRPHPTLTRSRPKTPTNVALVGVWSCRPSRLAARF